MPRGQKLKPGYMDLTLTGQCGREFDGTTERIVKYKFKIHARVCDICFTVSEYKQHQVAHILKSTGKVIKHTHPNPNFKKRDKKNLNPKKFKESKQNNNMEGRDPI